MCLAFLNMYTRIRNRWRLPRISIAHVHLNPNLRSHFCTRRWGDEILIFQERRIHLLGIESLILCLQFCKLWQYMPDLVEDILGLQEQDHRIATQERRTHRCKWERRSINFVTRTDDFLVTNRVDHLLQFFNFVKWYYYAWLASYFRSTEQDRGGAQEGRRGETLTVGRIIEAVAANSLICNLLCF